MIPSTLVPNMSTTPNYPMISSDFEANLIILGIRDFKSTA
jgi:hypothetical protein